MSLGPLHRSVRKLLEVRGVAQAVRLREPVFNGVPHHRWDKQVGPYRRYVQFAPLSGQFFGWYGLQWGQWIGDENGGHGVAAPDQFDARSLGDLDYSVRFLQGWLIDDLDWKSLPRVSSLTPPRTETITLRTKGSGFVIYSPFALAHVERGEDYLASALSRPEDVARHFNDGRIAMFSTASSGEFELALAFGGFHPPELASFRFKAELGLEVRDETLCVRDLRDLARWDATCPSEQTFPFTDGLYKLTVASNPRPKGSSEVRRIRLHFEIQAERPELHREDLPVLG